MSKRAEYERALGEGLAAKIGTQNPYADGKQLAMGIPSGLDRANVVRAVGVAGDADGHRFTFPVTQSVHSMSLTWQRIGPRP